MLAGVLKLEVRVFHVRIWSEAKKGCAENIEGKHRLHTIRKVSVCLWHS